MSSQESFDSTPLDSPNLSATSLPASQEISSNMLAVGSSYGADLAKLTSPSPPSSMTPPPSSQAHNPRRIAAVTGNREITPTTSSLSSPPPSAVNGIKRDNSALTAEQLSGATKDELREMLEATLAENRKLEAVAAEARMSAAHYKLQHNLLAIETEEAAKRMEVEHDMTRREVDVLQHACQGRDSPAQEYVAKLKEYCYAVEQDNFALVRRLENAKKLIEQKDDLLTVVREREELLTTRIRQNREHINQLRSPGGIFHVADSKSYPATPQQQYRSTPKHTPMTGRSTRETRPGEDSFAALLMADRVLSQENNSAPSTPLIGRQHAAPRTPVRHHRNVQSLSSLPTTPYSSARSGAPGSALLPSVQFTPREDHRIVHQSRERSRKSRDSTISASDAEEIARAAMSSFRDESEEVHESQASQTASEMLRIDPRESFEVAASRTTTPVPVEKSKAFQSKIYAPVTKTVMEKRKRGEDEIRDYSAKKLRVGEEGIGLGIGVDARAYP
jgi:hypothetical protein